MKWKPEEDKFIRDNALRGYPWLADNMDRTLSAIKSRAQKLKIKVRYVHPHDWTDGENDTIRDNHELGYGLLMGMLPGRSKTAIKLQAWRLGCPVYEAGGKTGEKRRVSSSPYAIGPRRMLIAQTCAECGRFKVAGQFEKWSMVCIKCRSSKRAPSNRVARQRLQEATLPAPRNGFEWTSEENEELKKAWENKESYVAVAKKLGRTYFSVIGRVTDVVGVQAKPSKSQEQQWLIWFAEPEPRPEFEWDDEKEIA